MFKNGSCFCLWHRYNYIYIMMITSIHIIASIYVLRTRMSMYIISSHMMHKSKRFWPYDSAALEQIDHLHTHVALGTRRDQSHAASQTLGGLRPADLCRVQVDALALEAVKMVRREHPPSLPELSQHRRLLEDPALLADFWHVHRCCGRRHLSCRGGFLFVGKLGRYTQ